MTIPLRQSTAGQEVALGYFVDSGDGDTEETALSIANTDIKLWKNGATALADKNSGGATHMANGLYVAVFDATDSDTAGALTIFVHVAGARPVQVECEVYPAAVYDALFGSGNLAVDLVKWRGATPNTLQSGRVDSSAGAIAAASVVAIWSAVIAGYPEILGTASYTLKQIGQRVDIYLSSLNDLDNTEVQAAAAAALNAYDPPTKAEMDDRTLSSASYATASMLSQVNTKLADVYQAKVWMADDEANSLDRWSVRWFKNGIPLFTGITDAEITVESDAGVEIIDAAAMTQIGTNGRYKYEAGTTERMVDGETYEALVSATIDGDTRHWTQQMSRDSRG